MKYVSAIILAVLSSTALAQSSRFDTMSPAEIAHLSDYKGSFPPAWKQPQQYDPLPATPSTLLEPLDARPGYPTQATPIGTPANGYNISNPNSPTIKCIPIGNGNISCS